MRKNKGVNIIIYIFGLAIIAFLLWKIYPLLNSGENKDIIFNIKSNDIEVKIGDLVPIYYEISENVSIKWESSNPEVAIVNNGAILGIGFGNALIKGTVINGDQTIIRACHVSTYTGDKNNILSEIVVPEGELFITKGDNYKINYDYDVLDPYITSIIYDSLDSNIVSYSNGVVYANNIGVTNITIKVNQNISKSIVVNVIERSITPTFFKRITGINISSSDIVIKPGDIKKIEYEIVPTDGFIDNIKWESSDPKIVSVDDGIIVGKSSGEAIIEMTVNGEIIKKIKVTVSVPVTGLSLKSNNKIVLKVGETTNIKTSISPSNATNKNIVYSNSSSLKIDKSGLVTAISPGTGDVLISTEDGNYGVSVSYTINPVNGIVNGDGGIWGYTSINDKVPKRADIEFFRTLASNGKGTLSGNIYNYNDGKRSYKYDISTSTLSTNGNNILMRIYYPLGVDLSEVNTFTFFGGSSERNMQGYFKHLDSNTSELSSSGIIILVSAKSDYSAQDGILSTAFVKSIVNQKTDVTNTVGGYSMSGAAAGLAADNDLYKRLIIFDSYINVNNSTSLKNKEIVFFSPVGDSMISSTMSTLNRILGSNYQNVTIVSNNSNIISNSNYKSKFLIINPGNKLGSGHGYVNISNARVFAFACK